MSEIIPRGVAAVALVTRFATSPTGYLHLGHALSALYVWGLGRHLGAKILLRIEDHDRARCRPAYEAAILADLRWLGLVADNQDEVERRPSLYRQSDRAADYEDAVAALGRVAPVYACDCSRRQIAAGATAATATDATAPRELHYDGRCRSRGLARTADLGLRLTLPAGPIGFRDLLLGPLQQDPAPQCGDLLLRDRHGQFTYQLAVTVDDWRQGVNLVIRGQDLTASTARQILVGRWLGRAADAQFAHHPLLIDGDGRKLGKRFLSEALAKRRLAGERPEDVLGEAAFLAGLTAPQRPLTAADLPALFARGAAP